MSDSNKLNHHPHLLGPYLHKHAYRTNALYLVVLGLAFAGIGMLPVVKISLTVQGRGIIRPVAEKTEIKSFQTEMVSRVYITEGQRIYKGDTLLALRSDVLSGRIRFLSRELDRISQYIDDLSALTSPGDEHPSSGLYMQQYRSFESYMAELSEKIRQEGIKEERSKQLLEKEIIPVREYESQVNKMRLLAEEKDILVSGQMAKWKVALSDFMSQREELQHQIDQAFKELNLYTVIAPVGGTIEEFRGIFEGSLLYAGEIIAVISPDAEMIVEVVLPAGDIGYIHEGQKANIQVDAFNYQQWGFLEGTVTHISDDFMMVDNIPAFVVKCNLDKDYLRLSNGTRGALRKGMTVNACFVLAQSSLWHLLLQRSDDWLNPSRFSTQQDRQ